MKKSSEYSQMIWCNILKDQQFDGNERYKLNGYTLKATIFQ